MCCGKLSNFLVFDNISMSFEIIVFSFLLNVLILCGKLDDTECVWDNAIDLNALSDPNKPLTCTNRYSPKFKIKHVPCGNDLSCNINYPIKYASAIQVPNTKSYCDSYLGVCTLYIQYQTD